LFYPDNIGREVLMNPTSSPCCTAFAGPRQIAAGELRLVALKAQESTNSGAFAPVLIFDDVTSHLIEVDLRGTADDLLERIGADEQAAVSNREDDGRADAVRRPGRPKLGVVAREVTLLPRHWDWLAGQPGGASVALRKLVEHARRANQEKDRLRLAQEAAYRFMSTMAGNEPGFEEASRALFAGNRDRFAENVERWPVDVKNHAMKLARRAFDGATVDSAPQQRFTLDELLVKSYLLEPVAAEDKV
jgi:hypothetical protein